MIEGIKTLDDIEVSGKTVLLRVDINCPIDTETKEIKDDTRIRRSLPTIRELSRKRAKVVILGHQGDPLDYQNFTSLQRHFQILQDLLQERVNFIDDVVGPAARLQIKNLKEGQILLLENIRIHTEETIIFEKEVKLPPAEQAKTILVKNLSPLADVYVCDAFACVHRSEPSLVGFPQVLLSACGRLFEEELKALTAVTKGAERPCLFILGGAKVLDAFKMMSQALEKDSTDYVLTTGLVGQIMLRASGYNLGEANNNFLRSKNLEEFIEVAKALLNRFPGKILYPRDVAVDEKGRKEIGISSLPIDALISDIGKDTVRHYASLIRGAKTVFMNGPAGIYEDEKFAYGTREIWEEVANSIAFSILGGGDTIAAARKFGLESKFSYISTAGGGLIRFLSGEKLPVLEALQRAGKRLGNSKDRCDV